MVLLGVPSPEQHESRVRLVGVVRADPDVMDGHSTRLEQVFERHAGVLLAFEGRLDGGGGRATLTGSGTASPAWVLVLSQGGDTVVPC